VSESSNVSMLTVISIGSIIKRARAKLKILVKFESLESNALWCID